MLNKIFTSYSPTPNLSNKPRLSCNSCKTPLTIEHN